MEYRYSGKRLRAASTSDCDLYLWVLDPTSLPGAGLVWVQKSPHPQLQKPDENGAFLSIQDSQDFFFFFNPMTSLSLSPVKLGSLCGF